MKRSVVFCTLAVTIIAALVLARNVAVTPLTHAAGRGVQDRLIPQARPIPRAPLGGDSGTPLSNVVLVAAPIDARAVALDAQGRILVTRRELANTVSLITNSFSTPASESGAGRGEHVVTFISAAGNGETGFSGDGGWASAAELNLRSDSLVERSGIAVARNGTIYVADTNNNAVRAISGSPSGEAGIIRSVAAEWLPRQGATLELPMGIAADQAGNVYIADRRAGAVDLLLAATGQLETLAQVASPTSIAVNTDGTKVFVASLETGGVFEIRADSRTSAAVRGLGPITQGRLISHLLLAPSSIDLGATSSAARESASAAPCATLSALEPKAGAGAIAEAAELASAEKKTCPAGLAVDGRGNLFVADANAGKILRVDAVTSKLTAVASELIAPGDIAFDRQGDLFVSEQGKSRIIELVQVGDPSNLSLTPPATSPTGCPAQPTSPYTFCNEPQGGNTPTAAFRLTNNGTAAVTGLSVTPPIPSNPPSQPSTNFTVESMSCTSTLAAGASCTINIAFTPQSTGALAGTVTVTDTQGDSTSVNLVGTGDSFQLQFASGQAQELTVLQGGTATWMLQVAPDNVFGINGEKVTFVCPTNMPTFTTCAYNPCPAAITPGTTAAFSLTIVTSSLKSPAPVTQGPCSENVGAAVVPSMAGPGTALHLPPEATSPKWRFPALASAALLLAIATIGVGARRKRRVRLIFAAAGVSTLIFVGCKGGSTANKPITPIAVTNLTIVANALDSNGNPLNASRSLQITLDVVKGK